MVVGNAKFELSPVRLKVRRDFPGHRDYQGRLAFEDSLDLKACLAKQPP
jgi:hypothetical protein